MQVLNDPWPWQGTLRGHPLDIADLIATETLSPETAAILAWTIGHGASLFVAAGPPGAGKSTIANALLTYLPSEANVYVTAGAWDRMDIPETSGPVYLLINELSGHMPVYLSGGAARRAFELMQAGARLFGTLHARNSTEALRVMCYEAELAPSEIRAPFVFAAVRAGWNGPRIERRVIEIGFLAPGADDVQIIYPAQSGFHALAAWANLTRAEVEAQIAAHALQIAA